MVDTFTSISTVQAYLYRWGGFRLPVKKENLAQVNFAQLEGLAGKGNMVVAVYGTPPGRFREIDDTDRGYIVPDEDTLCRLKEANEKRGRDVLYEYWAVSEGTKTNKEFHEYSFRDI